MKNSADQKKTVFKYLLLNELSDVSEKNVSLIGYLWTYGYKIYLVRMKWKIYFEYSEPTPKADGAYILKINDWIRIMEWIRAL